MFKLQKLDTIYIEEDSVLSIDLDLYINNYGGNMYSANVSSDSAQIAISESALTLTPNQDYFGDFWLSLIVETPFEKDTFNVNIIVLPVDDPTEIEVTEEVIVGELESVSFEIPITDVDDKLDSIGIKVYSSNEKILISDSIEVVNSKIVFDIIPLDYVSAVITIEVSNKSKVSTFNFTFEASEVLVVDRSFQPQLLTVFPNPATNYINIDNNIKKTSEGTILYDAHGYILQEWDSAISRLDLHKFKSGLYFLQIGGNIVRFQIVR